jgi:hypothetical protein
MNDNIIGNSKLQEETFESSGIRYKGFGFEIFEHIQESLPFIFENLKFYQPIEYQQEDLIAIYKNSEIEFGIQLDPLIEVTILWNDKQHIEISFFSENYYIESLDIIKSFLTS